jgi:hypothetical protein
MTNPQNDNHRLSPMMSFICAVATVAALIAITYFPPA